MTVKSKDQRPMERKNSYPYSWASHGKFSLLAQFNSHFQTLTSAKNAQDKLASCQTRMDFTLTVKSNLFSLY